MVGVLFFLFALMNTGDLSEDFHAPNQGLEDLRRELKKMKKELATVKDEEREKLLKGLCSC